MLFYRLEHYSNKSMHPVNEGPYRGSMNYIADVATGNDYYNEDIHPIPEDDPLLRWNSLKDHNSYVFGFSTLDDLDKWFYYDSGMRGLDSAKKARIGVYEASEEYIIEGQQQTIALASELVLVETLKCCKLDR